MLGSDSFLDHSRTRRLQGVIAQTAPKAVSSSANSSFLSTFLSLTLASSSRKSTTFSSKIGARRPAIAFGFWRKWFQICCSWPGNWRARSTTARDSSASLTLMAFFSPLARLRFHLGERLKPEGRGESIIDSDFSGFLDALHLDLELRRLPGEMLRR